MKAKEFILEYKKNRRSPKFNIKPRTGHAPTQTGAGAHKDMKRAEKQGDVKHKKDRVPMEGWSDAYVARRTGRPRTPYSVYINGKKWKDFENDDHARAVMDKLKVKFKADGRNPETITIAPTDIPEDVKEASALEKFRKAAAEREKKHDDIEAKRQANAKQGKEDMKGAIDRLEKHLGGK